jgi:hypothetical protein
VAHPAPSSFYLVATLGWLIPGAWAQTTPAVPPIFTSTATAIEAQTTPAVTPAAPVHALSAELAATISPTLPHYQDPAAEPAAKPVPLGQPKNQVPRLPIVALPQVTVRTKRIRDFNERESYTSKGLQELAVKRYLSDFDRYFLNRFTIPIYGKSQKARAMALYDQDEYPNNWRAIYGYDRLPAPNDPPAIPDFSRSPTAGPEPTGPKNSAWPKPWPRPSP